MHCNLRYDTTHPLTFRTYVLYLDYFMPIVNFSVLVYVKQTVDTRSTLAVPQSTIIRSPAYMDSSSCCSIVDKNRK
jgi:hypothetical protein